MPVCGTNLQIHGEFSSLTVFNTQHTIHMFHLLFALYFYFFFAGLHNEMWFKIIYHYNAKKNRKKIRNEGNNEIVMHESNMPHVYAVHMRIINLIIHINYDQSLHTIIATD